MFCCCYGLKKIINLYARLDKSHLYTSNVTFLIIIYVDHGLISIMEAAETWCRHEVANVRYGRRKQMKLQKKFIFLEKQSDKSDLYGKNIITKQAKVIRCANHSERAFPKIQKNRERAQYQKPEKLHTVKLLGKISATDWFPMVCLYRWKRDWLKVQWLWTCLCVLGSVVRGGHVCSEVCTACSSIEQYR